MLSVLYQNREQNISYHSLCHRASQAYTCQVVSTQYSLKMFFFWKKLLKVQIVFFHISGILFCLDICYLSRFTS